MTKTLPLNVVYGDRLAPQAQSSKHFQQPGCWLESILMISVGRLAAQNIGTPANQLANHKLLGVVTDQSGTAKYLWINGERHEEVKFTIAGHPVTSSMAEVRRLAWLFAGFEYDERSGLYFAQGRPFSAGGQQF